MQVETLSPELRRNLKDAFDRLSDLLEEETGRLARADSAEIALYAEAKRGLFEQLGILLREARTAPPVQIAAVESSAAEEEESEGDPEGEEVAPVPDPAAPLLLRDAARRLRARVEENRRGLVAAQEAVASVAGHLAKAVHRQQTDGVYARSPRPSRTQAGFGRVEHEL